MQTTADFIEALKAKHGLKSNYAVAKFLNQTDTAVARWSKGHVTFSDEMAMHMAELLDLDPAYVVACVHAERASSAETKSLWERIAANMHYATAAVLVLAVVLAPTLQMDLSGFALAGVALSGFVSAYLAPRAMRELVRMQNVLAASSVSSSFFFSLMSSGSAAASGGEAPPVITPASRRPCRSATGSREGSPSPSNPP